jgi:hypothetical protein
MSHQTPFSCKLGPPQVLNHKRMRPFTILLGILLGSAVSIAFGLFTVWIVFFVLAGRHPELRDEMPRLLASFGAFVILTAASGLSFLGELQMRRWRLWAQLATLLSLLMLGFIYWPKPIG